MNNSSFMDLLVENTPPLMVMARKFTRTKEDAEDLLQETLCKALAYQDNFKSTTNIGAWLYVIMRNIFINNYRRRKKTLELTVAQTKALQKEPLANTSYHPDISTKNILAQIQKLPCLLKKPFVLHLEGYKYTEIAWMLDLPVGTIKSRIHFAKQALKSVIKRS
ncbi:RNA polymerase sigma factor [Danxiaibacter flavus]|uniref:RNA polymerase sigma factor n=1 Tax=Danxiaibacter flavus TaxID=3049108 RepID=A0ABV3ZL24_9BACT|nr:RNA polymerase sigma factor [Chitinophagaceae bacterium DXS]